VLLGHGVLNKVFRLVSTVNSTEAFLSVTLLMVVLCSQITEGLGVSNTLGAFFGGILLAETDYKHQVETVLAPFRGMLLGLFFVTVGFQIDLRLLSTAWTTIVPLMIGLLAIKIGVVVGVCRVAGIPKAATVQVATLLGPGGEFAFVCLGLGERLGLLTRPLAALLMTTVALSMATTPLMGALGDVLASKLQQRRTLAQKITNDLDSDDRALYKERATGTFIAVCGYGRVGRTLCELFDAQGGFRYVAFEKDADKAKKANAAGLPVFLADCSKKEVLERFHVRDAKLFVVAIDDATASKGITDVIRAHYPELPLFVRAADEAQREEYERQGITAIVPKIPNEADLIALPFSSGVFRRVGISESEIDGILEQRRRSYWMDLPGSSKSLTTAFEMVVEDSSAELGEDELKRVLKNLGKNVSDDELHQMFAAADLDGNGKVNFYELAKMLG